MQRVNLFEFHRLATSLSPFKRGYTDPTKFFTIYGDLLDAQVVVTPFVDSWQRHLPVSRAAALELKGALGTLVGTIPAAPGDWDEWWNRDVRSWEIAALTQSILRFESVLAEEANTATTYLVSDKGAYNVSRLVDDATVVLPASTVGVMPASAVFDFKEAGKCLGLDLFTACGFHVLRSLEAVIIAHLRQLRPARTNKARNWGKYARELETAGGSGELVGLINQIKDFHRNPLMHPEDILDEDEAIELFDIAKSAISVFAKAILVARAPREGQV